LPASAAKGDASINAATLAAVANRFLQPVFKYAVECHALQKCPLLFATGIVRLDGRPFTRVKLIYCPDDSDSSHVSKRHPKIAQAFNFKPGNASI
jgi:hypothetical protein